MELGCLALELLTRKLAKVKLQEILILLAILVGIGIYIDLRSNGILFGSDSIISRDTIVVNLPPQTISLPPGQPINIINQPIPSKVDTGAILKAFFREVTYLDSLDNDTVKIVLKEVISENAVRSRTLSWNLKLPLTTIVESKNELKPMFFYGGIIDYSNQMTLSPSIGYKNKRDQIVFLGFDPFNKQVKVGGFLPLKK